MGSTLISPLDPIFGIFMMAIEYFYITIPVVALILSFIIKSSKVKISLLSLNVIIGLYLMITADNYAGGGGFGDVVVALYGIILLFISSIQGIFIFIQIKRNKDKSIDNR